MRKPIVLVIDSGVGGLSVTAHIRQRCPGISVSYIADMMYFPYGQKTEKVITERVHALVDYGVRHIQPDLVVIACNTASTVTLDSLRQTFTVPFVGVVPAIKPAVEKSHSGIIGILGTRGTVERPYTQKLISSFANDKGVFLYGSSVLVEIAESKLRGAAPDEQLIREDIEKLLRQHENMDTVVLACTHFPLLDAEFQRVFPEIRFWVDSGDAIARRVEFLLSGMGLMTIDTPTKNRFILTAESSAPYLQDLIQPLLGQYMCTTITI